MEELLNGTMADAVEKLAAYATALRTRPLTDWEKRAMGSDFLASLGTAFKENPTLGSALAGGGLGAAVGGVSTALGNRGKDPNQKKGLMGSMLTGGLAGAGIGAGASMAHKSIENLKGQGAMGHDALKPGEFTVKGPDGQPTKMRIDPKALKDNPDLHKQVKALTTPSLQSSLAGGVGGAWDAFQKAVPTSAAVLPYAAGADALWHGAGLGSVNPGKAGGGVGRELFRHGLAKLEGMDPAVQSSMNAPIGGTKPVQDPLTGEWSKGRFSSLADNRNPGGWLGRQIDTIRGKAPWLLGRPNPETLGGALGSRGGSGEGGRVVAEIEHTPTETVKVKDDVGGGKTEESMKEKVHKPKTEQINEKMVGDAKRFGADEHPYYKGRRIYRGPLGGTYSGAATMAGGLGRRAAVVAPLVGAEYLARGMSEDVQNKQTLRDLMAQHAKPVPEGK